MPYVVYCINCHWHQKNIVCVTDIDFTIPHHWLHCGIRIDNYVNLSRLLNPKSWWSPDAL